MSFIAKYARRIRSISVGALVVVFCLTSLFDIIVPYSSPKEVNQAFIPIVLAAVAAAVSIAGAISANNKKKKLAAQMEAMKLNKPEGLTNAERTLSALASQGLPGKDLMEDALKEPLAQSLTNMRELGASPVTVAGMASQGMSDVTGNVRQLMVEDARAKMGNMVNLANFQAGPMAQFDLQQQEFNMNKELGASYARMEGTAELYQGISNGIGTLGSAVGNNQYLNYLKSLNAPSGGIVGMTSKQGDYGWSGAQTPGFNQGVQASLNQPANAGNNLQFPNTVKTGFGGNPGMSPEQFKAAQFQWQLAQTMNPSLSGGLGGANSGVGNLNNFSVGFSNNINNIPAGVQNINQFKVGGGSISPWGQTAYSTPTQFTQPGGIY